MHQIVPELPCTLGGTPFLYYPFGKKFKFCPVLLIRQSLSRYKVAENVKCINQPPNYIGHSAIKLTVGILINACPQVQTLVPFCSAGKQFLRYKAAEIRKYAIWLHNYHVRRWTLHTQRPNFKFCPFSSSTCSFWGTQFNVFFILLSPID